MKCPICRAKIDGWRGLGNLPMIAQCPENPIIFYFLSDVTSDRDLLEIVSERGVRVATEVPVIAAILEQKGFHAESEFHFIDKKDGLDIILAKMSRGPFHPNIVSNERQMELLRKYAVTSLIISKEAKMSGEIKV